LAKINFRRGGDALPGVVANQQVGPTFSEIAFGNHSRAFSKMSWPHLQLGCEIVRGRGVHAASTPPGNITLKRAEARAPSVATVLIKPL